jgi:hypothetical protein
MCLRERLGEEWWWTLNMEAPWGGWCSSEFVRVWGVGGRVMEE